MSDRIPITVYRHGKHVPGYAKGGLAEYARKVANAGRKGDTRVIHVNEAEFQWLRKNWGEPSINPKTHLPEYSGFMDFLEAAAPAASGILAPSLSESLGIGDLVQFLGVDPGEGGNTVADALTGAGTGALTSTLLGTNPLTGALEGSAVGALSANASDIGKGLNDLISPATAANAPGVDLAPRDYSLASAANSPSLASMMGADSNGVSTGPSFDNLTPPSTIGVPQAPETNIDPATGEVVKGSASDIAKKAATKGTFWDNLKGPLLVGGGLTALKYLTQPNSSTSSTTGASSLAQTPGVNTPAAIAKQAENQPLPALTLLRSPKSEMRDMQPQDWYRYGERSHKTSPGNGVFFNDVGAYQAAARGGLMHLAHGGRGGVAPGAAPHDGPGFVGRKEPGGDGRSDGIPAMLSNGEYVWDAETTGLLGDGDNDAGAKKLDEMREIVRQHKGKALARGKISPKAPSPLALLKKAKVV